MLLGNGVINIIYLEIQNIIENLKYKVDKILNTQMQLNKHSKLLCKKCFLI